MLNVRNMCFCCCYSNYIFQIDNLRKEIESKDEIISKLSTILNNITNNLLLKNPTVALNNNNLLPETATSNYNENILPSVVDCSIQRIVKDKEDCASILTRSTKSNTQIADYKQQKSQHFYLVVSNSKIKVKHVGQKGLPFNPKGKGRLALNFIHKIRGL